MISTTLLNFSCGQNVESSPVALNEKPAEPPQATPTPDKYQEFDIIGQFSSMRNDDTPTALKYEGYKIKKVAVKKRDEYDNPEAEIYDLVVSKNGKVIYRFEGSYNPLENWLGFGFYQFLKGSENQLFIVDQVNRDDREWIVSLSPRFEVLFDTSEFGVESLSVLDVNNDGEKEISLTKMLYELDMGFPMSEMPWLRIIFKYDAITRKYLPASHIFTGYTLSGQEERIRKFRENSQEIKRFKLAVFFEIFMTYIYAGQETEAWTFFDENLSDWFILNGVKREKEQVRVKIKAVLNEDPIYKYIRKDLRKRK